MLSDYFEEPPNDPITHDPLPTVEEIEDGIQKILEAASPEHLKTKLAMYCIHTLHEYILLKDDSLRGEKLQHITKLSGYLVELQARLSPTDVAPGS